MILSFWQLLCNLAKFEFSFPFLWPVIDTNCDTCSETILPCDFWAVTPRLAAGSESFVMAQKQACMPSVLAQVRELASSRPELSPFHQLSNSLSWQRLVKGQDLRPILLSFSHIRQLFPQFKHSLSFLNLCVAIITIWRSFLLELSFFATFPILCPLQLQPWYAPTWSLTSLPCHQRSPASSFEAFWATSRPKCP